MAIGEMRLMGTSGDTKIVWDSEQDDEVENARRTFNDLKRKGYAAFDVGAKGQKGERIQEFDPDAEKLIMVPAIAGG
jgi:hypothetical protein